MINYDRKYKFQTLNINIIEQLNNLIMKNPSKKILIEIPNTKGLSSDLFKKLDYRISIRIAGAYDEERVSRLGNIKYADGETGQYYTDAVIYSRNEVVQIISAMEKIEKDFKGQNFSQFEKLVHIYGRLKSSIMYDPKFECKPSSEIRSLRGFITRQTVCAGYALMLKEMLDRQGIQCYYVSGTTSSGHGHAWNIVSINGKNYPIDLTWDNSKFRSGYSNTFDFLGQDIKKFKKNHIPADNEPCKNLILSEISPEDIKIIQLRMAREKDYTATTYYGKRNDGSRYILAQVGDNERNGKKYFRYYYADLSKDGKLFNQTILFSRTNITNFVYKKIWGKQIPLGYEEALDNILFSKKNIADSLSKGNYYIGQVRKIRSDNQFELVKSVSEIYKSEDEQRLFRYPIKEYVRSDGTTFIVQQMTRGQNANGIKVNQYHIFEVIFEKGKRIVKRNVIYSEMDLFKDTRQGIPDDFLSRDRLDRKFVETGGYIGFYSEKGIRTYNRDLAQFFKSTESVRTKRTQEPNIR